ncbi:MAG TPA: hypothetical protein VGP93_18415 [Polyangiaceae bacterium]|nr:hypothetical protein [Polyangiaceae bacterium]
MSPRSLTGAALVCALLGFACRGETKEPGRSRPAEPSPNASILPAPLASESEARSESSDAGNGVRDAGSDAGVLVPVATREDRALGEDVEAKDLTGLSMEARWRWLDVSLPSRLPEANAEAIERARAKLEFEFDIDLASTGRMRLLLGSDAFVLPRGSELRASAELWGHALIWPDQSRYTVVPVGALRAVLNERRSDVVPLAHTKAQPLAPGEVLGVATERKQILTPLGKLDLDQTHSAGSALGGMLLCRFLLELGGADPESSVCAPELVPLRAEYTWAEGGRAAFEVVKWSRGTLLDADRLMVPPSRAGFARGEMPQAGAPLLVPTPELLRFRLRPVTRTERSAPPIKEGLLVVNRGELAGYLLVDGVPVLRSAPRSDDVTLFLVSGTYSVQARDFLGTVNVAQSMISVPARVVLSEAADSER